MKKIKQYKGYELRSEEAKFPDGKSKGWFVNWIVSPQGSNAYMDNKETEGIENFEEIVDVCIEHGDEHGNYPRRHLCKKCNKETEVIEKDIYCRHCDITEPETYVLGE